MPFVEIRGGDFAARDGVLELLVLRVIEETVGERLDGVFNGFAQAITNA